nr:MAG TPA: TolA C-terminal [Caudoviricetes sp.]
MVSGRIRRILLLISFLMVASNSHRQQCPQALLSLGTLNKNLIFTAQISHGMFENFFDIQSYRRNKCTVRTFIQTDGMLLSTATEKGDPEFFQVYLSAASRVLIPPVPDKDTWQKFRNASLTLFSEGSFTSLVTSKT